VFVAPIIVAVVLLVLLLSVGLGLLWQERRRTPELAVIYGEEDSIEFIMARLSDDAGSRLGTSDVRRILEWSVRYLQDPDLRTGRDAPPIAGGTEAAEYVQSQAVNQGFPYDGPLIMEVLDLQIEYLVAIGAVGDPVAEDE
jgi:hypothetical protein